MKLKSILIPRLVTVETLTIQQFFLIQSSLSRSLSMEFFVITIQIVIKITAIIIFKIKGTPSLFNIANRGPTQNPVKIDVT